MGSRLSDCLSILCEVEEVPKWEGQWLRGQVTNYLYQAGFIPVARDFEWLQYNIAFVRCELMERASVREILPMYYSRLGNEARQPQT